MKPQCQDIFEYEVKQALESVCSTEYNDDVRPKLLDLNTGLNILVDTGASRSIWPRAHFKNAKQDPTTFLRAVNGGPIITKVKILFLTFYSV